MVISGLVILPLVASSGLSASFCARHVSQRRCALCPFFLDTDFQPRTSHVQIARPEEVCDETKFIARAEMGAVGIGRHLGWIIPHSSQQQHSGI